MACVEGFCEQRMPDSRGIDQAQFLKFLSMALQKQAHANFVFQG